MAETLYKEIFMLLGTINFVSGIIASYKHLRIIKLPKSNLTLQILGFLLLLPTTSPQGVGMCVL